MIAFFCRILGNYLMLVAIVVALIWMAFGKFDDPTHQVNIFIGCLAAFIQFIGARVYLARHPTRLPNITMRKPKKSRWITKRAPTPIVTHSVKKAIVTNNSHWVHAVHHLPPELANAIMDGLKAADAASMAIPN